MNGAGDQPSAVLRNLWRERRDPTTEKWARLGLNQRPLACEAVEVIKLDAWNRGFATKSMELTARLIYADVRRSGLIAAQK